MINKEIVKIFTENIEKYDTKKFKSMEDWFIIYNSLNQLEFNTSETQFNLPITKSERNVSGMVKINTKCKNKKIKNLYSLSLKSLYPHILVRLMDNGMLSFDFTHDFDEEAYINYLRTGEGEGNYNGSGVRVNNNGLSNILSYLLDMDYDKKDESYIIYKAWINYTYGVLSKKIGFSNMSFYSNQIMDHIIKEISNIDTGVYFVDIYYVDTDTIYFKIDYDEFEFMEFFKRLKDAIGLPFYVEKHQTAVFFGKKKYVIGGKIKGYVLLKDSIGTKLGGGLSYYGGNTATARTTATSTRYSDYGDLNERRVSYSDYIAESVPGEAVEEITREDVMESREVVMESDAIMNVSEDYTMEEIMEASEEVVEEEVMMDIQPENGED
ncbi:MAG: putative DNA polymerase I [uncultured marine phage]|uniref:Putative DNA polymerase I n=1 Tax=uncultured marine phage TaxID=707152 RepID=A0A8D9CBN9_9VIRU|nr:MAG: putative DNA polymerase I [uncultured marine phage]